MYYLDRVRLLSAVGEEGPEHRRATLPTSCLRSNRLINAITLVAAYYGNRVDNHPDRSKRFQRAKPKKQRRGARAPIPRVSCSFQLPADDASLVHGRLSTCTNAITSRDSLNRVHVI